MNFIYIYFDYKELYHLKSSDKPSHTNKIHIYFTLKKKRKRKMWQHEVCFFPAVTCPGIEAQLSEHVTWRLVSGSLNEYGAQVVLSCSPGYYLEGRRLLQCHANGTWSVGEERPRCRGEWQVCPRPRALLHPWWQRHLRFNGLSSVILCISGVTKWHLFSLQWGMYIFIQHT